MISVTAPSQTEAMMTMDAAPLLAAVRRHLVLPRGVAKALKEEFEQVLRMQIIRPVAAPVDAPLTEDVVMSTQEAAEFLNVSRPFLVDKIDAGEIPLYQRVGKQRRVLKSQLVAWLVQEQKREQAMRELADDLDRELFG